MFNIAKQLLMIEYCLLAKITQMLCLLLLVARKIPQTQAIDLTFSVSSCRTRDDTIRCIIMSLTDQESGTDLAEVTAFRL